MLSPTSSLLERQTDAHVEALRRNFQHGYTSLDVARRKWASYSGKAALTNCANSRSRIAYAQDAHHWPASLPGAAAVRRGVEARALHELSGARSAAWTVLDGLEDVVAGMHTTVAEMRARLAEASHAVGAERACHAPLVHTESASQLLARADDLIAAFGSELRLRRAVVEELAGRTGQEDGADGAVQLYLSAWVLEPHLNPEWMDGLFQSVCLDQAAGRGTPGRSPRQTQA